MSVIAALGALVQQPTPVPGDPEITFTAPAQVIFAVVAVVMIYGAIRVVTTRNVVHAALWLMIVLGGVGINYVILQAEFVAVTQFLVYLGAILVLFLFGIMLTRAPMGVSDRLDNNLKPVGAVAALGLLAVIGYALIETFGADKLTFQAYQGSPIGNSNGRTQVVSDTLFGQYLLPFEILSILLLTALIGAIVLARKD